MLDTTKVKAKAKMTAMSLVWTKESRKEAHAALDSAMYLEQKKAVKMEVLREARRATASGVMKELS